MSRNTNKLLSQVLIVSTDITDSTDITEKADMTDMADMTDSTQQLDKILKAGHRLLDWIEWKFNLTWLKCSLTKKVISAIY